jgi:2-(1,2-epoxy-1,2-dihydrophenyl)acetyl-CoA isomerase
MEYILKEISGNLLILKLNRESVMNSFNRQMALELIDCLDEFGSADNLRCLLLTGVGKAFCAGQDLNEVVGENSLPLRKIVNEHYNQIVKRLREIEKPIVCVVNGVAAGAGANIALNCDITFALESAKFIQAFSAIGLIPDSGGTYLLPQLVGMQRASALAFLGERIDAKQAEAMGMIYKALPEDKLMEEALGVATKLSEMPTKAIGLTKRAFNRSYQNTIEEQLALEEELQVECGNSYDYKEGVNAFLEKRKPVFTGK